jgi:hypothetical protein
MPLSTSNSEDSPAAVHEHERQPPISRAHIVAVLAILLGCLVGTETGTRFAFARLSRIERRIMTEHASALRLRRTSSVRPILLVGDSLLLDDVDMSILSHALPAELPVQRFSMETTYLDWLYDLRRMFSEGARPSTVILCIGPRSLVSSTIRGDSGAYYLFQASDIPAIATAARYDLTMESSLFFAHYSLFYSGRSGLRNFILNKSYPAYANVLHALLILPLPLASRDEVLRICAPRFQELEQLCASYGTHFVYLMPPGFSVREDAFVEAAASAGASILVPVHTGAWPLSKFSDGFHLNETAAREFTQMLGPSLAALLRSIEATR